MICKCGSKRVMSLYGKVADRCVVAFDGQEQDGYPPTVKNICGNDDIQMDVCLECGLVQGEFPVPDLELG